MTLQSRVLNAAGPETSSSFADITVNELAGQIATLKGEIDLGSPTPPTLKGYIGLQSQIGLAQLGQEIAQPIPRPDFVTAYATQYSRAQEAANALVQEIPDAKGASRLQAFWHHQAGVRGGELALQVQSKEISEGDASSIHANWLRIADEYRAQQTSLTGPMVYSHGKRIGTNN